MTTNNCSGRPASIFSESGQRREFGGKIRGYAMSASNYGVVPASAAAMKPWLKSMNTIRHRLRGGVECVAKYARTHIHTKHNEKADETSNTKLDGEGDFNAAFGIVVEQDMPDIHQQAFVTSVTQK